MPKYEIGIKMEPPKGATAQRYTRGLRGMGAVSSAREAMQQAQDFKRVLSKGLGRDTTDRSNRVLIRSVQQLDKSLIKLDKSITDLNASMRGGRAPSHGPGGPRPGGFTSGFGARFGGVGRAMGFLGVPIAAMAYVTKKALDIGRASIAKVLEQQATAGVAGLQTTGRYTGVFSAAEFGRYMKERRMAAGTFAPNVKEYQTGKGLRGAPLGVQTAAIFGTGAEFAKTAGLLDISARVRGRTGEQELNDIITRTFRRGEKGVTGIGTELPFLLREITSNMEEAVREGINGSDMAKDMASQVVSLARVMPGGQVRTAMQIQKSLMDVQKQAARGPGDVPQWRMHIAARRLIMGTGIQSQQMQKRLVESGLATPDMIEAARQRKLSHNQMMMLTTGLNQLAPGAVREEFMKDIVTTVGGQGTQHERASRLAREGLRGNMLAGLGITPVHAMAYVDHFDRKKAANKYNALLDQKTRMEKSMLTDTGRSRAELSDPESTMLQQLEKKLSIEGSRVFKGMMGKPMTVAQLSANQQGVSLDETVRNFQKRLQIGAPVRREVALRGEKEAMTLSGTAGKLRESVHIIDKGLITMATRLAADGALVGGINSMNYVLEKLAKGGVRAAAGIGEAVKTMESFVDRFRSLSAKGGISGALFSGVKSLFSDSKE